MKKSDIFWQTYLNLEKEVLELSKYIYITDVKTVVKDGIESTENCNTQLNTFSSYIADLLVRCCVQIEAISKELYYDNNGDKPRGDNSILFDEDCLKLIDLKWQTHNKRVLVVAPLFNLTKEENRELRPLKEAHKRQGTYWERAYQAVKHDRYGSMCCGNVKALIHAMAALYLLNVYYRKEEWIISFQNLTKQDFSLGSSLFAVKAPKVGQLWYGNKPEKSDSPFVVSYKDEDYKRIEEIQQKENAALNNYWRNQPELKEPAFLMQLSPLIEKQKQDPSQQVMYMWELAKYRLHKQIPAGLNFEERKSRLINSEAWKCWINQNNKHLSPDEITEDNIDREIDSVGTHWGMQIEKGLQRLDWLPIAMNTGMCRVYIPD